MKQFGDHVHTALAATPVATLLATSDAVVLERLARGGGATNWYYCRGRRALVIVSERFRSGSVVSFYFDNRIARLADSAKVISKAGAVIASRGECVVGALTADECTLDVDFVGGTQDVREFLEQHQRASLFFAGEFPARDNDGCDAVTITLPDLDGEVRQHPH